MLLLLNVCVYYAHAVCTCVFFSFACFLRLLIRYFIICFIDHLQYNELNRTKYDNNVVERKKGLAKNSKRKRSRSQKQQEKRIFIALIIFYIETKGTRRKKEPANAIDNNNIIIKRRAPQCSSSKTGRNLHILMDSLQLQLK